MDLLPGSVAQGAPSQARGSFRPPSQVLPRASCVRVERGEWPPIGTITPGRCATQLRLRPTSTTRMLATSKIRPNPEPERGGYAPRWEGRIMTRFEERGIEAGRTIHDLEVIRNGQSS